MAKSNAQKQKEYKERKWAEVLKMPKIPCECGCGTMIPPLTRLFEPARFARGHGAAASNKSTRFKKGQKPWNAGIKAPSISEGQKGKPKSPESIAKRTATRRAKNGGVYQTARGWKHTPETIETMKVVNKAKALKGEKNPFYGKKHTPETLAINSEKHSGEKHPQWRGGVSTLPYGPEFTREYKRMIRKRDQYTCQHCGITQAEHGSTLQIHHMDFDKMNNDPTNLVTACNKCNIWANFHRDEPFIDPAVWARTHP